MNNINKDLLTSKIIRSRELTALEKRYLEWIMAAHDWIPCSERMPDEPGIHVLVTDGIHIMESWYEVIDEEMLWVDNYTMYVNVNFGKVTHWMPLPEPPKGDPT